MGVKITGNGLIRASLWLIVPPAVLVSLEYLAIIGTGFDLYVWRLDRPLLTAIFIAGIGYPAFLIWVLSSQAGTRWLRVFATLAWAFVALWVYYMFFRTR